MSMCRFFDSIRNAALHEAGHIVAAYFAEYSCTRSSIDHKGNGLTIMNYGEDNLLAGAIISRDSWQLMFAGLPNHLKANAQPVAYRLSSILVAGAIAEAIHKHGRNFVGNALVDLSGPDLRHAVSVCRRFQIDIRNLIASLYEVLKLDVPWRTIRSLAKRLLWKSFWKRGLTRAEIEAVLARKGYLEFLKQL